jgi:hypothetical protein
VEAADKWDPGISKGSGQIVSFEYDVSGAFDRTEEAKQISVQNIKVANRPETIIKRPFVFASLLEKIRVIRGIGMDCVYFMYHFSRFYP